MVHVEQAIVVEGRYDKNTLSQIVDTVIFQTNGFSVMHDRELLALLRCAAQTRGLDHPDGFGRRGAGHPELSARRAPKGGRAARLRARDRGQGETEGPRRERRGCSAWRA